MKTAEAEFADQGFRVVATLDTIQWLVKNCGIAQPDGERLGQITMEVFEELCARIVAAGGFKESTWKEIKTVLRAADHFADAYIAQLKEWVQLHEHEKIE